MTVRETWFTIGFGGATALYMVASHITIEVVRRRRARRIARRAASGPRIIDVLEGP